MGVHGLWEILGPTARPVRLESLGRKKLAVDASIWIYQFLKAMRDKEGHQLKNAHIVGFFRRICKLLYFGIQPVFVFDGGVPVLKRQTIAKRRQRREGKKETVKQTARRLLAQQLQKNAEKKQVDIVRANSKSPTKATKRKLPMGALEFTEYYEDNNYFDGEKMVPKPDDSTDSFKKDIKPSSNESRMFKKQDDYDLPHLENIVIEKNDNRVITDYEYDRLTKDLQDDLQGIDLNSIDPQSAEFNRLPLSTQYVVLSHLRLRSRLRMGYSKDQLETLFPNSMDFSKFQIQMVQKRNFLTQRLMNVNGMDTDEGNVVNRRIAGDRDKAYALQRNEDGWSLSIPVQGDQEDNPIKLDDVQSIDDDSEVEWEDVDTDVTIKRVAKPLPNDISPVKVFVDPSIHRKDGLFVEEDMSSSDEDADFEDVAKIEESDSEDEDVVMARIKSLYEYAERNNKGNKMHQVSTIDDDVLATEDEIAEQVEQRELKDAIERSKEDYLNMKAQESSKAPISERPVGQSEGADTLPILLSKKDIANSNLPFKFDLSKSIMFKGPKAQHETTLPKHKETSKEEKPKAKPLPSWFENSADQINSKTHYATGYVGSTSAKPTDDEKAGLYDFEDFNNAYDNNSDDEILLLSESDNDDIVEVENNAKTVVPEKDEIEDIRTFNSGAEKRQSNFYVEDQLTDEIPSVGRENETSEQLPTFSSNYTSKENDKLTKVTQTEIDDVDDVNSVSTSNMKPKLASNNVDPSTLSNEKSVKDVLNLVQETRTAVLSDYEFSENESEELEGNLQAEEDAYASFVSKVGQSGVNSTVASNAGGTFWSLDDEKKLQEELRKQRRDADEVSTEMILDVQDLLSRFGIPFITAPMEAEAQCARAIKWMILKNI
ncbi:unnamed protein product [Ambrosiozyma monospora]|uniref:Unnamed protein product n=1 Tax=Ambrosiozyma monospora TaxID=43982 RepID=A0A9W6YYW8_AMBMO|nr:unnamed protein product [Ambrosiozyma monospora]